MQRSKVSSGSRGRQRPRKRTGTKFVVPDVSFSKKTWFKVGLDLFDMEFPLVDRDFWIPDLETKSTWHWTPPDYARSLQWMHHWVHKVAAILCLIKLSIASARSRRSASRQIGNSGAARAQVH